jgi:peptide/nickel transport system ATP-binding protein
LLLSSVPDPAEGLDLQHVERRPAEQVGTADMVGCRFAARCPLAIDRCSQESPALVEARSNHTARCHVTAPEPWHASA